MKSLFFNIPLGIRYAIMAAMGFSLMSALVKLASIQGIPVLEIIAARALVSLFLSLADIKRKRISPWGQQRKWLLARGMVGTVAMISIYYAITRLPLAEVTVIKMLMPVFTSVLALVFLREFIPRVVILCIVLSFVGLLLITRPEFLFGDFSGDYESLALLAALLGAVGSSVAYLLVRKLSPTEDSSVIIFYFPLVALPVSLLLLGEGFVMPEGWQWLILLGVGVMTQVGQVGITNAMKTETAGRVTSLSYLQVLFAVVLGYLVFGELPDLWVYCGAAIILAAAFINVIRGNRQPVPD